MKKQLHVAAAAICRDDQVFISLRDADKHQGGLWEFPGGKIEEGETALAALSRELEEELGIRVTEATPLIQVPYDYPDLTVCLHIFEVTAFEGEPWGKEGQPTRWIKRHELADYTFPAANQPIVNACLLPKALMITPEVQDGEAVMAAVKTALAKGTQGVVLRSADSESESFKNKARELLAFAEQQNIWVSLNTSVAVANDLNAPALHLNRHRLAELTSREEFNGQWLSASCHDAQSLNMALEKGVDFVFLSPVLPTASHPGEATLGLEGFAELANSVPLPVFALGGVELKDLPQLNQAGATGFAAISAWS